VEESTDALARIRDLLERERVSDARSVLQEALVSQPHDEDLSRLQSLLAPPQVRESGALDTDRTKDFQWLSKNAAKHRGGWVAIHEGKLVADATSLDEVLERVSALALTHTPLIHFID
jgi:hypothetical protein